MSHSQDRSMTMSPIHRRVMLSGVAGVAAALAMPGDRPARAADEGPLQPIQHLCSVLIEAMKAGRNTSFDRRFQMLAPVIDNVFDLVTILQVSVGPAWPMMPNDQRSRLETAFRRYTVASYVNSFDNYTGQRFEVQPQTRNLPNGDQVVKSRIIPTSGDSHELDYVMRNESGRWRAVDVLADGAISRVAVQRSDFRRLLARGGSAALIASLQEKSADLSGGAGG
jgi:phospholipid transport system substrate-binding protein